MLPAPNIIISPFCPATTSPVVNDIDVFLTDLPKPCAEKFFVSIVSSSLASPVMFTKYLFSFSLKDEE